MQMVARIFLLREKLFFLFKKACRACLARMSHVRLLFDEKSLSFVFWNTIREGIKATMEYNRMGSLFMPSMKTELVEGDDAFKRVLHYIHGNSVHHGFVP